jgi:hypothetical protein
MDPSGGGDGDARIPEQQAGFVVNDSAGETERERCVVIVLLSESRQYRSPSGSHCRAYAERLMPLKRDEMTRNAHGSTVPNR